MTVFLLVLRYLGKSIVASPSGVGPAAFSEVAGLRLAVNSARGFAFIIPGKFPGKLNHGPVRDNLMKKKASGEP